MKKLLCLLLITGLFHFTGFAQQSSSTDKQALANEEIKKELVSKLSLSEDKAAKIIAIENEFHASLSASNTMSENSDKEKKEKRAKVHAAHVLRRTQLMEIPLTGRQMEDVIEAVENIRRKHKL